MRSVSGSALPSVSKFPGARRIGRIVKERRSLPMRRVSFCTSVYNTDVRGNYEAGWTRRPACGSSLLVREPGL